MERSNIGKCLKYDFMESFEEFCLIIGKYSSPNKLMKICEYNRNFDTGLIFEDLKHLPNSHWASCDLSYKISKGEGNKILSKQFRSHDQYDCHAHNDKTLKNLLL